MVASGQWPALHGWHPGAGDLERPDRERLERLAGRLGATKSDVLRRGLAALELQLADPAAHPALRLIGLAERESARPAGYDVAREHDRAAADDEAASWQPPAAGARGD